MKKFLKYFFLSIFAIFFTTSFYFFIKEFTNSEKVVEKVKNTVKKETKKEYKLSVAMVGDALYHTGTFTDGKQADGSYNYDSQLTYIEPIISKYDIGYYNQESILGGKELGLSSYPTFNSPQEVGDAFQKAGFNMVSLANNHTLDKGIKGVSNSVAYWRKQKAVTAGSYDSAEDRTRSHIHEKNNIKYAFFSYTTSTNGIRVPQGKEYLVDVYSEEKVAADIASVKDKADVIFVAMHWGTEYTHTPTEEETTIANYLASLGVNVVIGAHPHVIQPIEHIGDTVVIYSLGNFISGQIGTEKRVGLLATLNVNKVIEDNETKISITDVTGDLLYTSYSSNYQNVKVIPFANLNNSSLANYQTIKEKYEAIINKNDSTIKVGSLG